MRTRTTALAAAIALGATLAIAAAASAATIDTNDPALVAAFQSGATIESFDAIGGRTPLEITAYTSGLPVPDAAKLFDQVAGLQFTVGGAPGDSPAALLTLGGAIAGDAVSAPTVLAPATMSPDQVTDFSNAFIEVLFDTKMNRVGFWLNPSLGNVLVIAFDAFAGNQLESIPTATAGNFVGFDRPTNDIGAISIISLGAGFTIDDLSYGTTTATTVPEPGTLSLLSLAALTLLARRRRS